MACGAAVVGRTAVMMLMNVQIDGRLRRQKGRQHKENKCRKAQDARWRVSGLARTQYHCV